jgi:hypothetical protein
MSLHRRGLSDSVLIRLRSPSKNNMANLYEFLARDKIPPDLKPALNLLRLDGYDELEARFLSTDAFLRPWSVFRDSIFLKAPYAMPRPTKVIPFGTESSDGVSRGEILTFYTNYDEGTLRYDPRADKSSRDYTADTSVYGIIDKINWRVEEYEKHLFAWLLQEFKVGKKHNPWHFEYFQLRSVAKAWEEVLVPIVNAVRASYRPGGRRNYGRLALFIEARCPSELAFPGSNVSVPAGGASSATPYRVVSVPKQLVNEGEASGTLSRKHYDATEKELRDVYPQYGGLVERPKFKHNMDEWLNEQRARAARRKGHEQHGQVQPSQPLISQTEGGQTSVMQTPRGNILRQQPETGSPIKRCADSIKRSLSKKMSSLKLKEEPKSPLHGVTRQLHFPERVSSLPYDDDSDSDSDFIPPIIKAIPRPQMPRDISGANTYNVIRNSNPFDLDQPRAATAGAFYLPIGHMSETPRPSKGQQQAATVSSSSLASQENSFDTSRLLNDEPSSDEPAPLHDFMPSQEGRLAPGKKTAKHDVRAPSYEGTEYQKEISLTDLHTHRLQSTLSPPVRTRTPATRLPAPIVPVPYSGPRVASADTPGKSPEKPSPVVSNRPPVPVAWPGPIPKATPWPGYESDDSDNAPTPPIPAKSPERQIHNPRSRQPVREDAADGEVYRIVSRENIRAALGGISRESSTEDLAPKKPFADPARTMSPVKPQLATYNTHLFPRKETTVVGRVNGKSAKDGGYEMEDLKGSKRKGAPE